MTAAARAERPQPSRAPYYREIAGECAVFDHCADGRLPLLLKGPTGCGKSRFIEAMAAARGRPLITVACNDDTSATDLLGRWLIRGGDTVWHPGPLTRAVREGAVLYLDEIAEAREYVIVVIHPLTDHRRALYIDKTGETLAAPAEFMLVVSFNPGYQRRLKELKPSTRQRFVALTFDYPEPAVEAEIVATEGGCDPGTARRLVDLARRIRAADELALPETASTRLLVNAAQLIARGLPPRRRRRRRRAPQRRPGRARCVGGSCGARILKKVRGTKYVDARSTPSSVLRTSYFPPPWIQPKSSA